jgi:hypothetical protein
MFDLLDTLPSSSPDQTERPKPKTSQSPLVPLKLHLITGMCRGRLAATKTAIFPNHPSHIVSRIAGKRLFQNQAITIVDRPEPRWTLQIELHRRRWTHGSSR